MAQTTSVSFHLVLLHSVSGIINVALPHIERMWRKPAELSKKIEEGVNENLAQIIRLLPVSYPLRSLVLGTAFHVGNLFQVHHAVPGAGALQ